MKLKTSTQSYVETNHIVLPSHANALNTMFGGVLMSWIDVAAAISAQRHAERICVTASVDALHFLAPVYVGDTVTLKAQVVYTGKTSMIVSVEVSRKNPRKGEEEPCVTAHLSMVAVNEKRRPIKVPQLKLVTAQEKRAFRLAAERRNFLLARLHDMQTKPKSSKS